MNKQTWRYKGVVSVLMMFLVCCASYAGDKYLPAAPVKPDQKVLSQPQSKKTIHKHTQKVKNMSTQKVTTGGDNGVGKVSTGGDNGVGKVSTGGDNGVGKVSTGGDNGVGEKAKRKVRVEGRKKANKLPASVK